MYNPPAVRKIRFALTIMGKGGFQFTIIPEETTNAAFRYAVEACKSHSIDTECFFSEVDDAGNVQHILTRHNSMAWDCIK